MDKITYEKPNLLEAIRVPWIIYCSFCWNIRTSNFCTRTLFNSWRTITYYHRLLSSIPEVIAYTAKNKMAATKASLSLPIEEDLYFRDFLKIAS